jgi:hypothetical protein
MIKIERSTAVNPTILRNSTRQPVTLNMTVTQAELDSLEADSGEILYTVDEMEVKTVVFQPIKPSTTAPAAITAPTTAPVVAAKTTKPIVQPARKTARATQT